MVTQQLKLGSISVTSALSFLVALYVFGYAVDEHPDENDISISKAIADGNGIAAGTITAAAIGTFLLIALQYLRKLGNTSFYISAVLLLAILGLFISIIYVTPYDKDGNVKKDDDETNDAHIGIAATAFTLLFIYNLVIYYLLHKTYKTILPIILAVLNTLVFIGLWVPAFMEAENIGSSFSNSENEELNTVFGIFENINYCSLIVVILLLGFYKV